VCNHIPPDYGRYSAERPGPPDERKRLSTPNALGADFTSAQQNAILHGLKVRVSERTRSLQQLEKELFGKATKTVKTTEEPERWKQAAILGFSACLIACIALVILLNKDRSHSAESPTTNTQLDSAEATIAPTSEPTVKARWNLRPLPRRSCPARTRFPKRSNGRILPRCQTCRHTGG
jgi:hypothetical protein